MNTPHKCPKCNGVGYLKYDPSNPFGDVTGTATSGFGRWNCNACTNGIIWSYDPIDTETAIKQAAIKGEES